MKTALVIGGTGLIGRFCVNYLLDDPLYEKVIVLLRTPLPDNNSKMEQHIINFDELDKYAHLIKADDLFYCLGSTMKKAGSKKQFHKIDFEYALKIAQIAASNGIKQFHLVSSIGANRKSGNFYLNVKGSLEEEIGRCIFDSIHIYRPSMLVGKREETRTAETIAFWLMRIFAFLFIGGLKKYKPINAGIVARVMITNAKQKDRGIFFHESGEISNS